MLPVSGPFRRTVITSYSIHYTKLYELSGLFGRESLLPTPLLPVLVVAGAYLTWGALVLHREQRIRD